MARVRVVRHDDLYESSLLDEWDELCFNISEILTRYARVNPEPMAQNMATRLVLFAMQVASAGDNCPTCDELAFPYAVDRDETCRYHCAEGHDSVYWSLLAHSVNLLPDSIQNL